jgi:hypothetical protein
MVTNRDRIKQHSLYPRLQWISPEYEKDCVDCVKPGSYASVWNMIALSNMLNIKIESVYSAVNGSKHYAFILLNNVFRPPFVDPEMETITIMWTNTQLPLKNGFVAKRKLEYLNYHNISVRKSNIYEYM